MSLCTCSKPAVVDSLTIKTAGRFYLISSALQLILQSECTLSYPGESERVGCFPGIPVPGWARAKYKDAEQGASLSLVLSRECLPHHFLPCSDSFRKIASNTNQKKSESKEEGYN